MHERVDFRGAFLVMALNFVLKKTLLHFCHKKGNYNRHLITFQVTFAGAGRGITFGKMKLEKYASFLTTFLTPSTLTDLKLPILLLLF